MSSYQYYPYWYAEINSLSAVCVRRNGIDSMNYMHHDRLGCYTHITNSGKQVIRSLHFDPWGNVKSDADWTAFDTTTLSGNLAGTSRFDRGFTGHEHYAEMKIINMKAPNKREQTHACSFFVGGLAGLAGGAAGGATAAAVGVGGFLGGAASGAAAGAASCFITGTGNALIAGNDLATSLKCGLMGGAIGALGGALMGGLSRGILDARHGYNFWDGSFYEEFASGEIDKSISSEYIRMAEIYDKSQRSVTNDRYLNARVYETYGIQQGDFNIDVITTRVSPIMKTQEPPYGLTGKGEYINLQTGRIVRGYVAGNSAIPGVEYHISPYITSNSIVYFKAVAGHELTHAYHRYIFGSAYEKIFSEVIAYRYTYNMYSSANLTKEAVITMKTALYHNYWSAYPSSYKIPSPYLFY